MTTTPGPMVAPGILPACPFAKSITSLSILVDDTVRKLSLGGGSLDGGVADMAAREIRKASRKPRVW